MQPLCRINITRKNGHVVITQLSGPLVDSGICAATDERKTLCLNSSTSQRGALAHIGCLAFSDG
jgi:hypothetical protein